MAEKRRKDYFIYAVVKWLVRLIYPKTGTAGSENLPPAPAVIVGNHTQMNGPICAQLYMPRRCAIWCAGEMMDPKTVHEYAFRDFWSQKPRYTHWFYRILSWIITPLAVGIFNNADTIPVYRDSRMITTFRRSIETLNRGLDVVIFPEHDVKYNNIVYDFQENFVDTARFYYRKTATALSFVPAYFAPSLRQIVFGRPVQFDPDAPIEQERTRICAYLKAEITRLARELPEHTVIPYRNIPKKLYPKNTDPEADK